MDHLPSVKRPVRPPPEIPYLSSGFPTYDHGTFSHYPTRCRFNPEQSGIDGVMRFVQEWMFFGLMDAVFTFGGNTEFKRDDFIRRSSNGKMVITTEKLQQYLWKYMVGRGAGSAFPVVILEPTKFMFNKIQHGLFLHPRPDIVTPELERSYKLVMLSVAILGETLEGLATWGLSTVLASGMDHSLIMDWECSGGIVQTHLLEAGWCLHEIKALFKESTSPSYLYFLGTLDRRTIGRDHSQCDPLERCGANQIDESTYVTVHVEKGCMCSHVPVSGSTAMDTMCSILDSGHIPVIVFSSAAGGEPQIQVSASQDGSDPVRPYVAISHVWAGGLGNANDNSLPRCQLEKIQRLVNALYPEDTHPVPFWMDTLCVPLMKTYRKLAICLMSKTYREAEKVLVRSKLLSLHQCV